MQGACKEDIDELPDRLRNRVGGQMNMDEINLLQCLEDELILSFAYW